MAIATMLREREIGRGHHRHRFSLSPRDDGLFKLTLGRREVFVFMKRRHERAVVRLYFAEFVPCALYPVQGLVEDGPDAGRPDPGGGRALPPGRPLVQVAGLPRQAGAHEHGGGRLMATVEDPDVDMHAWS